MSKEIKINVDNTWKKVTNVWTRINNSWKENIIPYVKDQGVFKDCIEYYTPIIIIKEDQYFTRYDTNLNRLWRVYQGHQNNAGCVEMMPGGNHFISLIAYDSRNGGGQIQKRRTSDGSLVTSYNFSGYNGYRQIAVSKSLNLIAFCGGSTSRRDQVTVLDFDLNFVRTFTAPFNNVSSVVCRHDDPGDRMFIDGGQDGKAFFGFDGTLYSHKAYTSNVQYGSFMQTSNVCWSVTWNNPGNWQAAGSTNINYYTIPNTHGDTYCVCRSYYDSSYILYSSYNQGVNIVKSDGTEHRNLFGGNYVYPIMADKKGKYVYAIVNSTLLAKGDIQNGGMVSSQNTQTTVRSMTIW